MRDNVRVRICRFIDINDIESFSDFKWYCNTFKPRWYIELIEDPDYYLNYINKSILKRRGIQCLVRS